MNLIGKVEAYKNYYALGKEAFESGNLKQAREQFLRSAQTANEISLESTSLEVKTQYHNIAQNILDFVQTKCSNVQVEVPVSNRKENKSATQNEDDDLDDFEPVKLDHKITFDDVAGLQDVKDQIYASVIKPIKYPELAKRYNIKPGAKILLYGPPGTGKTFIARAIAGEVNSVFFSVNCQDLVSKYLGESGRLIKKLFASASKYDAATIFFDEFDTIAANRSDDNESPEMVRMVGSLLTEINGFEPEDPSKMLLLVAATNRPWALDPAVTRGGRFGTKIYVGAPDFEARKFMIEHNLKDIPIEEDITSDKLAELFDGYGGGDIKEICTQLQLSAFSRANGDNISKINMKDVNNATKLIKSAITPEMQAEFDDYRNNIR